MVVREHLSLPAKLPRPKPALEAHYQWHLRSAQWTRDSFPLERRSPSNYHLTDELGETVPASHSRIVRAVVHFTPTEVHSLMPGERRTQERHRFGVFELDTRSGELRKHGVRVRLQEQPVFVLGMLLERPGEVVTREEIQRKLWPADTFVDFDHGLNKAINKIRDALGDSAQNPRFVETVARRGYRFLAEVRVEDAVPVPRPEATTPTELRERSNLGTDPELPKHRRPSLTWALSGLLLFALIASVARWRILSANRSDT